MSVRQEVGDFVALGRIPPSQGAEPADVELRFDALSQVLPPVSLEEAVLLASVFGPDDYFGLAWELVHLIETTGDLPYDSLDLTNDWVNLLRERARRAHELGKPDPI